MTVEKKEAPKVDGGDSAKMSRRQALKFGMKNVAVMVAAGALCAGLIFSRSCMTEGPMTQQPPAAECETCPPPVEDLSPRFKSCGNGVVDPWEQSPNANPLDPQKIICARDTEPACTEGVSSPVALIRQRGENGPWEYVVEQVECPPPEVVTPPAPPTKAPPRDRTGRRDREPRTTTPPRDQPRAGGPCRPEVQRLVASRVHGQLSGPLLPQVRAQAGEGPVQATVSVNVVNGVATPSGSVSLSSGGSIPGGSVRVGNVGDATCSTSVTVTISGG